MGTFRGMWPIAVIVFFGFLSIGIPLPALSLQIHDILGFGPMVVGWVIGLQPVVTVATRHRAGGFSDSRGAKKAVLMGLPLASLSGVAYLISTWEGWSPTSALSWILLGRLLLGIGESLFLVGAMSWGISRLGPQNTGKVMSWQGIAMYAAIGVGGVIGVGVYQRFGFVGASLCTIATPLLAWAVALGLTASPFAGGRRAAFHEVVGLIWRPGMVLMLATIPFAAIASFLALYYSDRQWLGAGAAIAGFGSAYIVVRLVGSHWPDRFGGIRVAAISLVVEAIGQVILWLSWSPASAWLGATVSGIGFSLIFPSMGVEATHRVPAAQRGQAVGNFMAFFDISMCLTGPVAGLAIARFGYSIPFLLGAFAPLLGLGFLGAVRRMKS